MNTRGYIYTKTVTGSGWILIKEIKSFDTSISYNCSLSFLATINSLNASLGILVYQRALL